MLCYWVGEQQSHAWMIGPDSFSTLVLPGRETLDREIEALRRAVTARTQSMAGESLPRRIERVSESDHRALELARALGAQILPAARSFAGLRRLYIVADGSLSGAPFPALQPPGSADMLIRTIAVAEEPSASVLLSLARPVSPARSMPLARSMSLVRPVPLVRPARTLSRTRTAAAIAVFADPVYRRDDPRFSPSVARAAGVQPAKQASSATPLVRWAPEDSAAHLPRLLGSREEALHIERSSGPGQAVVRMGFDTTAQAVRQTRWNVF